MDRTQWLVERQAAVTASYDAEAPEYDRDPYPTETQAVWVNRLLGLAPPGGVVLDAPCGTGRYFPLVAAAGRLVVGVDASAGMLAMARARGIAVSLEHMALQDLSYREEFDAAMTIDGMENVPPEHWLGVLANLHRAVRGGAHLYLSVEEQPESAIQEAFRALSARGEPAVYGEIVEGDVAGYHYYPSRQRVLEWFDAARLSVVDEAFHQEEGWGYRHFLLRTEGPDT